MQKVIRAHGYVIFLTKVQQVPTLENRVKTIIKNLIRENQEADFLNDISMKNEHFEKMLHKIPLQILNRFFNPSIRERGDYK